MNNQIFKSNLEKLTKETKQKKIADALNITESKVSKWFTGTLIPTIGDLLYISQKYNCSIDWLIGNETNLKNQKIPSVHDVCKFLYDLDKALVINIELKEVTETVSFWDNDRNAFVDKKYEYKVPTMHFPRTLSITDLHNQIYSSYILGGIYGDCCDYSCMINNGTILESNIEINNFLSKYIKIRRVFHEGLIDEDMFNDIINSYLSKLSQGAINYFPYDPDYKPKQLTEEELEQFPFDVPDSKVADGKKLIMDYAEEHYNINDAIKHFGERFNAELWEEIS